MPENPLVLRLADAMLHRIVTPPPSGARIWSATELAAVLRSREPRPRGSSKLSVLDYVNGRRPPPPAFLVAAADALGVRREWLSEGTGPRTDAEAAELERQGQERFREAILGLHADLERRGEALRHTISLAPDLEVLMDLEPGTHHEAHRRHMALLRFARKLDDTAMQDAPWKRPEKRRDLLTAAHTFLSGVEEAFQHAGRWNPGARTLVERTQGHDSLLARNLTEGGYVAWADAALDLFSRRVYGLGERPVSGTHEPAPTPEATRESPRSSRGKRGGKKS